jgi:hypothetical protein
MRWLVMVPLLVLLAGCLGQSATPPAQADVQPDDDPGRTARQGHGGRDDGDDDEAIEERSGNVTLRTYADQYGFTLTSANALITIGNIQGYNCVAFEGAPFTILDGTATITWSPQSALTDSLDLQIRTYWDSGISETYSGTSPLVVEFKDLEVEADPDFEEMLVFGVEVAGPIGAAYEQDVTMDLAFEYESDIDVDPSTTYC